MAKLYTFLFVLLGSQAIFAQSSKPVIQIASSVKEIRSYGYNFISPLLDYYESKASVLAVNKILHTQLLSYTKKIILENKVTEVSVYYRDLKNGEWIGINENATYSPASLLKVPYLIAALRNAEIDPSFLSKQVVYTENENKTKQYITDGTSLVPGNLYTIEELLSFMILHSSNEAKDLVVQNIPYPIYKEIFTELGVDIQKYDTIRSSVNFLSVKQFASFFRVLYNATFLNKQMSEYALWLLSNTTFNDGIKAGLPDSILLSHKFGERVFLDSGLKQLHDCGIVYKPDGPYLVCIMTKGKDFSTMKKVIADISKIIYSQDQKTTSLDQR